MPYQIDVWGGDLHQRHIGTKHLEDWPKAVDFMAPLIDAGMLCNVLHTDFQCPPERVAEAERDLIEHLSR
jgi:hypothetical protein